MDYQLLLTPGAPGRRYGEPDTNYYQYNLDYFDAALRGAGLDPLLRLEPEPTPVDLAQALRRLAASIAGRLEAGRLNIVGLSNYNGRSIVCLHLALLLRAAAHEQQVPLMLVGGGPHFARQLLERQGQPMLDSVEHALLQSCEVGGQRVPLYDGVVCGGFQALVQLLHAVEADRLLLQHGFYRPLDDPPPGYFYLDRQQLEVVGQGRSRAPALDLAPLTLVQIPRRRGCSLVSFFSNRCGHGCGFCSLPRPFQFSTDQVLAGIRPRVLLVGIPSDVLYTASEVEALAQGIPESELAWIDSPHGHDAFLMELEEVSEILSSFRSGIAHQSHGPALARRVQQCA